MNPLLNGMNDKQSEAVQTTEGPLLIMAGAGSGKTRVLTHRIAYLIDEKMVNPWNILAITFTNKAAREMRERAMALNPATSETLIATFHSMCVRILRREADHIGYNRNFTIVDPGEQRTLMKRILKNLNLDPKKWNERAILGTISNAKTTSWMKWPMSTRPVICTPKSLLNVTRPIRKSSVVVRPWISTI